MTDMLNITLSLTPDDLCALVGALKEAVYHAAGGIRSGASDEDRCAVADNLRSMMRITNSLFGPAAGIAEEDGGRALDLVTACRARVLSYCALNKLSRSELQGIPGDDSDPGLRYIDLREPEKYSKQHDPSPF